MHNHRILVQHQCVHAHTFIILPNEPQWEIPWYISLKDFCNSKPRQQSIEAQTSRDCIQQLSKHRVRTDIGKLSESGPSGNLETFVSETFSVNRHPRDVSACFTGYGQIPIASGNHTENFTLATNWFGNATTDPINARLSPVMLSFCLIFNVLAFFTAQRHVKEVTSPR